MNEVYLTVTIEFLSDGLAYTFRVISNNLRVDGLSAQRGVFSEEISLMPISDMWRALGIGVAVNVSTSTICRNF